MEAAKEVVVRNYGVLKPLNWDKDILDHLYLQNKLWNTLVDLDHKYEEQRLQVTDSTMKALGFADLLEREQNLVTAREQLLENKREARNSKQSTASMDDEIKTLKEGLAAIRATLKAAKASSREQIKEATASLMEERKAAVKLAYQQSGLWWGNYNAVLNSFDVARSQVLKSRSNPSADSSRLQFHRFDGTGRFTVQIQGGMSTQELLEGRNAIARLELVSGGDFADAAGKAPIPLWLQEVGSRRDSRQYAILHFTVYTWKEEKKTMRRYLSVPVILHRPLPDDALLKEFSVNRKRVGADYQWSVTFTFTKQSLGKKHENNEACGVNFGWKRQPDGLRIATITDSTGTYTHHYLPYKLVDDMDYVDELKSSIDSETNDNFEWLKGTLSEVPEELEDVWQALKRAKHPHQVKFARFVNRWRQLAPLYESELLQEANLRRKKVKRMANEHHHKRDKVLRWRKDVYIKLARSLAERYKYIRIDNLNLKEMARLENANGDKNILAAEARRNRQLASLSELIGWLEKQAVKFGSVIERKGIASSVTCNHCGEVNERQPGTVWECSGCGQWYDQDENASANLLAA